MKNLHYLTSVLILLISININSYSQNGIYEHFSVYQCDSLIKANKNNPDFFILDVRTSDSYTPNHIEGAINRDYFDSNFYTLLDNLPKDKIVLLHCQSGYRSGNTFNNIQSMELGFKEVYNMSGGMNSWTSANLPTTSNFASLLMLGSDSLIKKEPTEIGLTEEIKVRVTNRANDTLKFTSFTSLTDTEFTTDFNIDTTLLGAEDYIFIINYTPFDNIADTLDFSIISNGGEIILQVIGNGEKDISVSIDEISVSEVEFYPNPANSIINIEGYDKVDNIKIFDFSGRQVFFCDGNKSSIDISNLEVGNYYVILNTGVEVYSKKLIVY